VSTVDWTPETLVADIKDLVTLPEVALRIARMVEDPNSSAADIGAEIGNDPALTARLLRVSNSAVFGQNRKIATISRAITVLGIRQVRDLTVGITAIRSFDGIANELVSMESFWRQSVLCALAAGHVAARPASGRCESPFVAGLLLDIGQLVMFSRAPQLARRALLLSVDASSDLDLHVCEREVFGFDHCEVGFALARNWDLPPSLQECIHFHHEPRRAKAFAVDVAIAHIAKSVAVLAEIGSSDLSDAPAIDPGALLALKLPAAELPQLVEQTRESAAEMLALLGAGAALPRGAPAVHTL
jgi:HD-like signal output (HDOD) protein